MHTVHSKLIIFYPEPFTNQENLISAAIRAWHASSYFQNVSPISYLYKALATTEKWKVHYLVDRLIRLVLTLPVLTATIERAFSAMKIVKTRMQNKMKNDFLAFYLVVYIHMIIAEKISAYSLSDDLYLLKER